MKSIINAIETRASINNFDTSRSISEQDIKKLIDLATHAPSAFNLQNWKFIAVHTTEAKARLLPLAYGQQKIVDSAVTFIVCGTLNQHLSLPKSLKPSLDKGIINVEVYEAWLGAANSMYTTNKQLQRDEAIRSSSLAAMTLMLAAREFDLSTCPMIGFDPDGVSSEFNLSDNEIPVMLITAGYASKENWPQKPRKSINDVLTLV